MDWYHVFKVIKEVWVFMSQLVMKTYLTLSVPPHPASKLTWLFPVHGGQAEDQVPVKRWLYQKSKQNKTNRRTTSHFFMLVGGKSRCPTLFFFERVMCLSPHIIMWTCCSSKMSQSSSRRQIHVFQSCVSASLKKRCSVQDWCFSGTSTRSFLAKEITQLMSSRSGIWTQAQRTQASGFLHCRGEGCRVWAQG